MVDWQEVKCYNCKGHCNKKGYPSVSKGSKYCRGQRGLLPEEKVSKWKQTLFNLQSMFMSKGAMRRKGSFKKKKEDEEENESI